jgi:hypothetical protein
VERIADRLSLFDPGDSVCSVESVNFETAMKKISHRDAETQSRKHHQSSVARVCFSVICLQPSAVSVSLRLCG